MKISLLLISFVLLATQALAVSSVGNGAGVTLTEKNPWFVGEKAVSYCIEMTPTPVTISVEEARREVRNAIDDWVATLKFLKPQHIGSEPLSFSLLRENMSLNFVESECSNDTDLRFLLAKDNAPVREALKHTEGPLNGFAFREAYDPKTGRAKGFIWISKSKIAPTVMDDGTSTTNGFFNIVLHELGHVFGVQHRRAGFMEGEGKPAGTLNDTHRLTSRSLAMLNWLDLGLKICGRAIVDIRSFNDYFGTSLSNDIPPTWRACLWSEEGNSFAGMKLEIFEKENSAIKMDVKRRFAATFSPFEEISGLYDSIFEQSRELRQHTFVKLGSTTIAATITANGKAYAATIITGTNVVDEVNILIQDPEKRDAVSVSIWIPQRANDPDMVQIK